MHPLPTVKLGTDFGVVNCPSCGNEVGTERVVPSNKNTRGRCLQCKEWFLIELPIVIKKLVYLDQSLLSDLWRTATGPDQGQIEQRILRKLQQSKDRQKVFLVVSDIHSPETAAFPREYADQRDGLWDFQNKLADGHIAGNWCDVFIAQQRRALAMPGAPEFFPSADIGLDDPHRWQIGVKIMLTNTWRGRLHRALPPSPDINDRFHKILTRQIEGLGPNSNMHGAIDHIRRLWRQDIEGGIASVRKWSELLRSEDLIQAIASSNPPELLHIPDSPFKGIVRQVVNGMDEKASLEAWLRQLETGTVCAAQRLRVALEAELLWSGVQGNRMTSKKKFSENYGASRQNDADHVAAFLPYVDVLTTDKDMHNLCGRKIIKEELDKFPCLLVSGKNYPKFENWLDNLLSDGRA